MKTNAKKRMLISSVAMLLVAMIALGTATFAWFTTSTTATASNINIHTAKASTLKIAGNDTTNSKLDWGSSIDYGLDSSKLLRPASASKNLLFNTATEKWYEATATSQLASAAADGTASEVNATNSVVFKNQLNVRNEGDAAVKDVKITVTGFNDAKYAYARIALVEAGGLGKNVAAKTKVVDDKTVLSNVKLAAQAAVGEENFTAATGLVAVDGNNETKGKNLTTEDQVIDVTPDSTTGVITFDVAESLAARSPKGDGTYDYATKYFNLYIWFEGQDAQCYSNNPVEITDLTFEVTGTTETQS